MLLPISEVGNKILDNSKYITTQEFNKLTEGNFAATLKQADLVNKNDFYNKLASCIKRMCMNVFDFSIGYNSIDKYNILNIHKYLMTNNKIKSCLACLLFY